MELFTVKNKKLCYFAFELTIFPSLFLFCFFRFVVKLKHIITSGNIEKERKKKLASKLKAFEAQRKTAVNHSVERGLIKCYTSTDFLQFKKSNAKMRKWKKICQFIITDKWEESLSFFFVCILLRSVVEHAFICSQTPKWQNYWFFGFWVDCFSQSEQIWRGAGLSIVQIMYAECDMQHSLNFYSRLISLAHISVAFVVVLLERKLIKSRLLICMSGTPVFMVELSTVHWSP